MKTKICSKCKQEKATEEFNKYCRNNDGLQSHCRECQRESYLKNKDIIIARSNKNYYDNKEMIRKKRHELYIKNKDLISINHKEYYLKNKEKILERSAKYYELNKEKVKDYQIRNKDKIKEYSMSPKGKISSFNRIGKRRSKIKQDKVSTIDILHLKENARSCYWCNIPLNKKQVHIDHYVPISKGGRHIIENLVISCSKCNREKCAKDPIKFANSIGKLL